MGPRIVTNWVIITPLWLRVFFSLQPQLPIYFGPSTGILHQTPILFYKRPATFGGVKKSPVRSLRKLEVSFFHPGRFSGIASKKSPRRLLWPGLGVLGVHLFFWGGGKGCHWILEGYCWWTKSCTAWYCMYKTTVNNGINYLSTG